MTNTGERMSDKREDIDSTRGIGWDGDLDDLRDGWNKRLTDIYTGDTNMSDAENPLNMELAEEVSRLAAALEDIGRALSTALPAEPASDDAVAKYLRDIEALKSDLRKANSDVRGIEKAYELHRVNMRYMAARLERLAEYGLTHAEKRGALKFLAMELLHADQKINDNSHVTENGIPF